ncbi:MAG: HesA/MoeB/ThiF family protein [Candidatus Puniceispirillaceae bacterium]
MTDRLSDTEIARYARQLILPEIGDEGQEILRRTKLGIIGAGGLGVPALMMAAGAGFGTITIIDDDVVDMTNLNRQFIYGPDDIGKQKAPLAASIAGAQNPYCDIKAQTQRFDHDNADNLMADHDIIIDASDNPQSRILASRAALRHQTSLIFVSAIRFEGQLALLAPHIGDEEGACYECLFPAQPEPGDVPNCATVGIAGPVTMMLGAKAALEAIKWQTKAGKSLHNQLLLFDALHGESQIIKARKQPDCPGCGA